jgi:hypothetical protein
VVVCWLSIDIGCVKIQTGYGIGGDEEEKVEGITRKGNQLDQVKGVIAWTNNVI